MSVSLEGLEDRGAPTKYCKNYIEHILERSSEKPTDVSKGNRVVFLNFLLLNSLRALGTWNKVLSISGLTILSFQVPIYYQLKEALTYRCE